MSNLIKSNKDSTEAKTSSSSVKIGDVVGGIFNKSENDTIKKDSVNSKEDNVKEAATSILGGLLGKKKKDSTKQN